MTRGFALAALPAVLAAVFLLGRGTDPEPSALPSPAAEALEAAGSGVGADLARARRGPPVVRAAEAGEAFPAPGPEGERRAVRGGAPLLRGRVLTAAGAPVAEALVVFLSDCRPAGPEGEERFANRRGDPRQAAAPHALTDGEGRFEVATIAGANDPGLGVWPGRADLVPALRHPLVAPVGQRDGECLVRLPPALPVQLSFVDREGASVAGSLAVIDGRLGFDLLEEPAVGRAGGARWTPGPSGDGAWTVSLAQGGFKLFFTPDDPSVSRRKAFFLPRPALARAARVFRL